MISKLYKYTSIFLNIITKRIENPPATGVELCLPLLHKLTFYNIAPIDMIWKLPLKKPGG